MPKSISTHQILKHNQSQMDTMSQQHISPNDLTHLKEQQKTRKVVNPPPKLSLPFPPHIIPEELISSKTRKLPSKPSNAFFIYRKVYTKELIAQNLRFKMTDVSPWVSISWKLEPEEVKNKYKEIAEEVRRIYKQTKLDAVDESETSSDNTSPEPHTNQLSTPLPTPPLSEDTFNFENSNPELVSFYDHSGSPNPDSDLDYYNNNTLSPFTNSFELSSNHSNLWQHGSECYNLPPTIFENISAESPYSKYMAIPNTIPQEPLAFDFFHDDVNWNYGEENHHQY